MLWIYQSIGFFSQTYRNSQQNSAYLSVGSGNDYTFMNTKGYCSRPSFPPIIQQKNMKKCRRDW